MIGIMGAMLEEIELLKDEMTLRAETVHGDRSYYQGTLYGKDVVLVFSKYGKVASSVTTTVLIHEFKITSLVFTGVAASLQDAVKIGDLVISNQLYQYDMDCRPLFKKYEIPFCGKTYFEADKSLVEQSREAAQITLEDLKELVPQATRNNLKINTPRVHIGTIASGDRFVTTSNCDDKFLHDKKETLALEMEGASVAQVCSDYKIPFVVIRTISDYANQNSNLDFKSFIKNAARFYSKAVIKNLLRD